MRQLLIWCCFIALRLTCAQDSGEEDEVLVRSIAPRAGSSNSQRIAWANQINGLKLNVPTSNGIRQYTWLSDVPHVATKDCTSPNGQKGKCRYLTNCAYSKFLESFNVFISNSCFIDSETIGVCCVGTNAPTISKITLNSTRVQGPTSKPAVAPQRPANTPVLISTPRPPLNNRVPSTPIKTNSVVPVSTQRPALQQTESKTVQGCGAQVKKDERVVGGQPAEKGDWPWMAALLRDGNEPFCGGALISSRHVLTAAHCVKTSTEKDILVRLGEYDFSKTSTTRKTFQVDKITRHEDYDRRLVKNDIALLKLKTTVTFSSVILPVCLPEPTLLQLDGKPTYIAGWGRTVAGGSPSDVLLEVQVPVWKTSDCQGTFPDEYVLSSSQICAGLKKGGKDSCQGDSGGPLMYQVSPSKWVVVGVVSFGQGCAEVNKPGIYTRVTSYLSWIKKNL